MYKELINWLQSLNLQVIAPYKQQCNVRRKGRKQRIRERFLIESGCCKYCGKQLSKDEATLDHVQPQARGGTNAKDNLVLACFHCNQLKGDKQTFF